MKRNKIILFFLGLFIACISVARAENVVKVPDPKTITALLNKSHPRLMLTDKGLAELKDTLKKDKFLQQCRRDLLKTADGYLSRPVLVYKKIGPRLLSVSRECLSRTYTLGLAWRLTGKEVYADKAIENLLAVCEFKDWNPSHFLDTAEMSHAVGVGYDWFYSRLDPQTREKIRQGLIENGLKLGIYAYGLKLPGDDNEKRDKNATRPLGWWAKVDMNWNQVCNMGLLIGALAIAETDPFYAETIVPIAVQNVVHAMDQYTPDGAWKEGPGYWHYATRYTVYGLAALESALGTDFGLSRIEGFSQAGYFPIYTTGPTDLQFNFADASENNRLSSTPSFYWLAGKFNQPLFAQTQRRLITRGHARPEDLIWYVPSSLTVTTRRPLEKLFRGPVEVAIFRSSWDDPDAMFVGVKAGFNQVNHGHLDLGSFVMDALGVRWARDLGRDDYNMPNYWDRRSQDGGRWKYYRLNSFSHNVTLLNNENQNVHAHSKIIAFRDNTAQPLVMIDLSAAYDKYADKAIRGVTLVQKHRALLIQDEFKLKDHCKMAWGMTTNAKISLNKTTALLSQDGKKLTAYILSPPDGRFSVESAQQKPPQKTNKAVQRLMIRLPEQSGEIRIAVLLSPHWPDGKLTMPSSVKPLDQW